MDKQGIIQRLDAILTELNKGSCERPEAEEGCLVGPEPWPLKDVKRMCQGCAAYWYVGQAINEIRVIQRQEEIIAAHQ